VEYEILAGLDDADRRAVLAACTRRRYARGEVVFHQHDLGDTFHHIASGRVTIQVTTSRGDVATIAVLGRGEGFGEQALLGPGQRRTASAVALEATETLVLSRSQFEDLRARHPTVDDLLLAHLARQVRRLTDLLVDTLFLPAEKRVLRRLLDLEELYDGAEIAVTQEELASMAGTTRPTANRVLQAAVDAGELTASRGRLRVVDRESLARRAR
jgi:CRP/FNR family cyclic AMP-dependent transcriptional regulator